MAPLQTSYALSESVERGREFSLDRFPNYFGGMEDGVREMSRRDNVREVLFLGVSAWPKWWMGNLPAVQETQVWSLSGKDSREKEMATPSSVLAWRIPWTEEPAGLQSMGSQRVGHKWATNTTTVLHAASQAPKEFQCFLTYFWITDFGRYAKKLLFCHHS